MTDWYNLDTATKQQFIEQALNNGAESLDDVKQMYANQYGPGGYLQLAKQYIKKHEGWRSNPYKDGPNGWRSVGYGFNDSGFRRKYPGGISNYYAQRGGITREEAEKELDWYLKGAVSHLKSIYGKRWDSFTDGQKAGILDTYYQRPASVGQGSAFYNALKKGKDPTPYLGVTGYDGRNKNRRQLFSGKAGYLSTPTKSIAALDTSDMNDIAALASMPYQEYLRQKDVNTIDPVVNTDLAQEEPYEPIDPVAAAKANVKSITPEYTAYDFSLPMPEQHVSQPSIFDFVQAQPYYQQPSVQEQAYVDTPSQPSVYESIANSSLKSDDYLNSLFRGTSMYGIMAEGGYMDNGIPVTVNPPVDDNDLIDFLIKEEGFLNKPTNIGDGMMTLGSGLTAKKWHDLYRQRGNRWSAEDNRRAVMEEVANRRRWAEANIPNWYVLPDSAQKALLAYKYNYDFTPKNSPKMFAALKAGNYAEAAKQMDATSDDPKFKKGLMERRKREQAWFMRDFNNNNTTPAQPVSVTPSPITYTPSIPWVNMSLQQPAIQSASFIPAWEINYNNRATGGPLTEDTELEKYLQNERKLNRKLLNKVNQNKWWANGGEDYITLTNMYNNMNDIADGEPVVPLGERDELGRELYVDENGDAYTLEGDPYAEDEDLNEFANGGSIHIKPENRGKFNATKRRTGKTTEELTHSKNPLTRKRAIFAQNARKWKHPDGGPLIHTEPDIERYQINNKYNPLIDDIEMPGYRDYMQKLAQKRAEFLKEIGYTNASAEDQYNSMMNDPAFNYRRWYNLASPNDLQWALNKGGGHWMDIMGKTVWHPTFSVESPYSGYKNKYNPEGIAGGTWTELPDKTLYEVNDQQLNSDFFNLNNTLEELEWSRREEENEKPAYATYNGIQLGPLITIKPQNNRACGGNLFWPGGAMNNDENTDGTPDDTTPYIHTNPNFQFKQDQYGRVQVPWFDEIFPNNSMNDLYPNHELRPELQNKGVTYGEKIQARKGNGEKAKQILDNLRSSDAIKAYFSQTKPYNSTFEEVVTRNNNQMKLADAVTYDNTGKIIPLSKRDNFNLADIRYALAPLGLGLKYFGSNEKGLGGNLFRDGSLLNSTDPPEKDMYERVTYATDPGFDSSDVKRFPDGRVIKMTREEWLNGRDVNMNDVVPNSILPNNLWDKGVTWNNLYDDYSSIVDRNNNKYLEAKAQREKEKTVDWQRVNNYGLRPVGQGNAWTDDIKMGVRDFVPYLFNKGVEYTFKPIEWGMNAIVESSPYLGHMQSMTVPTFGSGIYNNTTPEEDEQIRETTANMIGNGMKYITPSYYVQKALPDEANNLLDNTEWGRAAKNAFDLYTLGKVPKIIKGAPGAVDYAMAKAGSKSAAARYIAKNLNNVVNTTVPELKYEADPSKIRFKLGDVEMNDPNLMYHLDRGDHAGAFSQNGAFIDNGNLMPGQSKIPNQESYSWWNLGKPYATGVGENTLTRLVTAHKDNPNFIHVRSQNYPIGQWNGNKGFVVNSEYVSKNPIDVSQSTYTFDPNYGYRKVYPDSGEYVPSALGFDGKFHPVGLGTSTASPFNNFSLPDLFNISKTFKDKISDYLADKKSARRINDAQRSRFQEAGVNEGDVIVIDENNRLDSNFRRQLYDNFSLLKDLPQELRTDYVLNNVPGKPRESFNNYVNKTYQGNTAAKMDLEDQLVTLRDILSGDGSLSGGHAEGQTAKGLVNLDFTTSKASDVIRALGYSDLKNLPESAKNIIKWHEFQHALQFPDTPIPEGVMDFKLPANKEYFTNSNNTEVAARISQLYNTAGYKHYPENITGAQLKELFNDYLSKAADKQKYPGYLDNDMMSLFSGIKDWDALAEWVNHKNPSTGKRNVLQYIAPVAGATAATALSGNQQKYGGKLRNNRNFSNFNLHI